ncbi:putative sugar-phosphate nucleotidyl transferase [Aeropyrum pernix K1]|uniref:Sugar-phosphate nucleotidyl transferase n=2 Tax=Aeropyrum pernix TaxID=56636 RepID=Q9Y9J7_AERPE|nr:nucleotidyltransferase family protein [Aeropyrum pernix]BAA81303.1 putative sugar-phosphate nucleotidyl transferase [Aeropyrum pernix K1]GBF08321.1 putative sugar-phosphate nucleotidyl transferase [Aeropyrum pernix]
MLALILAGGYGKRLRPLTEHKPKPLLEVAGKPVLVHQIEWLRYYGVEEFVLLVGYLKERIIEEMGSGAKFGVKITYVVEDKPLGTAGALWNARHIIEKENLVLVVNGDIVTNIDPDPLVRLVREREAVAGIAAVPLRSPYGILELDDGNVTGFREKPFIYDYWINGGLYAVSKEIVKYLPQQGDIEKTTFPQLASDGKLVAARYEIPPFYWRSIDTFKDIEEASKEIEDMGGLVPPQKG